MVGLVVVHVGRRLRDPDIVLLLPDGPAKWLRVDREGSLVAEVPSERSAVFRTRVNGGTGGVASAELTVRALRRVIVLLNGRSVFDSGDDPRRWKEVRSVTLDVPPGESELALSVSNGGGPPMVIARSDALGLATDATWEASADGKTWSRAVTAEEPMRYARPTPAPPSIRAIVACLPLLIPAALIGFAWGWRDPQWITPSRVRWALVAAWTVLAINNLPKLPVHFGFDALDHVDYIAFIARQHRLPLASDGWQMFQSPLYYLISAPIFALVNERASAQGVMAILRLIPMACGAAQVELCYR